MKVLKFGGQSLASGKPINNEIEIIRSEGFSEYMYEDFTIGSGTEMNMWAPGGNNVVPEINSTVHKIRAGAILIWHFRIFLSN